MRVASYSRVSTSHHDQKPEIQIEEIRRFCTSKGWNVEHEIVDHGFSGTTANRPGLKTLMELVRDKRIECVVVLKLDRLFRSLKHLLTTLDDFQRKDIHFVAIKDNVDYSTPSGRLFVQILGSLAEFERSLMLERTLMGLAHARSKGIKLGRPPIHDKAEIVRLWRDGRTYREIRILTTAPMGTIARAISDARKSHTKDTPLDEMTTAPQTVVSRAQESDFLSIEVDKSISMETTEHLDRIDRNAFKVNDEKD
jgi:DNA invertase Pin-like site-specific DNA recombinase